MAIEIVREPATDLTGYASVPTAFLVTEIFDDAAAQAMLNGIEPSPPRRVTPYWKDYDSYPGNGPAEWPTAVAAAARRAGCRTLRVETQNVNVPACHFYRTSGFTLEMVRAYAYPDLPDERQMLWQRSLA